MTARRLAIAAIVAGLVGGAAGCQKLLGLDETTYEQQDAAGSAIDAIEIDAPSVCDATPLCTSSTGRSICGQLFTTGATHVPLRAEVPTGAMCTEVTATGPCALTVTGYTLDALTTAATTAGMAGVVDDCGHYAVVDMTPTPKPLAVLVDSADGLHRRTVSAVVGGTDTPGISRDIEALELTIATTDAWQTQMQPAAMEPLVIQSGFLITYRRGPAPIAGKHVARNNSSPLDGPLEGMPATVIGTQPWAAYFGDSAFGTLDPTNVGPSASGTHASGTAYADLGAPTTAVAGVGGSNRCQINLQPVSGAFVVITIPNC